ncbi:MAG: hypothetical protein OXU51_19405 [Candidatus Poribacteria bacterium]|nr:hypothetical protein [Candidatus Poribacteria bacterium]
MLEQFLHEQLEIAFNFGVPKPEMPSSITQNLSPAFELRPYPEDAYASFIVIGVPSFYHEKYENQFKDDFNAALKPATRTSEQ